MDTMMTTGMKTFAVLLFATWTCLSFAATPQQWRSRSIYFVMTDRFARTDGATTASCELRTYCGGSWRGLIDKLDYIKNMGFTAIWITPVTHNIEDNTVWGKAYHGYWQDDLYALNPHYGNEDDLKALAQALHERDMFLMVDVVANHFAFSGGPDEVQYSAYRPFDNPSYFHEPCPIEDYNNQFQVENCGLGYKSGVELTDLYTQKQSVKDIFKHWIKDLVKEYSIDGLRIDTVRHVQKDFWPGFNEASGVYNIGEVSSGDPEYLCDYQNYMDGLLNYALYYPLTRAFSSSSGSMFDLADSINKIRSICKDITLLGSFFENHDSPRFPSKTSDLSLVKNGIAFTILADGIPIIYYGQEQHFNGANDPENREALWVSEYKTDEASAPLYKFIATVNQIRNVAIARDAMYVSYRAIPIYVDTSTIAMRKGFSGSQIVSVFSNKGARSAAYHQVIDNTGFAPGEEVTEIFTCERQIANYRGQIIVAMTNGLPKIFYPTAKLRYSGICSLHSSDDQCV